MELLTLIYLLASVSFIIGLKMLSHPETARKGNLLAGAGMALAIAGTIFLYEDANGNKLHNYAWIFSALLIGGIIGTLAAKKVKMTAMPEMVSLFNGTGGACAALISMIEFGHFSHNNFTEKVIPEGYVAGGVMESGLLYDPVDTGTLITIFLGLLIGTVSFAGSVIAWGKLNGKIKDYAFKGQHIVNLVILAVIILLIITLVYGITSAISFQGEFIDFNRDQALFPGLNWTIGDALTPLFYLIFILAVVYGVLFVMPIGGADMPVVISLLNSFTGVAAACGGFLYNNKVMLTGGILVGAAGTLLTILMCKAMNRSLTNVLIGSFGGGQAAVGGATVQGQHKEIQLTDAAVLMAYSSKVMIVPGYGLAVAQAQHACHDLEKLLNEKGVEVKYAIHPVAGRMPGHMNVLLAEADVSYEKLLEMEDANEEFPSTDVVLILGANDVVNPAAKTNPASPIYGMPILDVSLAKNVIVNKRSMKPGYAGIENELFYEPKTSMLFGDSKKALQELISAIKTL